MKKKKVKNVSGTGEWCVKGLNCVTGCSHDCLYCYARNFAKRFHRVRRDEWRVMKVREDVLRKHYRQYNGPVMFPTTHDITPEVLGPCMRLVGKLVEAGNRLLLVSKPHIECVAAICEQFAAVRGQIKFRFSIGADDDDILSFWEPFAPAYLERMACLQYAQAKGFATSISIEPMLDSANIVRHVNALAPSVTDTIWLGMMNRIKANVEIETVETLQSVIRILDGQTDERIRGIYAELAGHPKIRWKDGIKKIMGLDRPATTGLDV